MFRDDNEEFMKSFAADDPQTLVVPNPPILTLTDFKIQRQKKLSKYIENSSFNMVSEQSQEKSLSFGDKEEPKLLQPVKKINWIKQSMTSQRKFSDSNIAINIRKNVEEQKSLMQDKNLSDGEDESMNNFEGFEDVPDRVENEPVEEDIETYLMKKIRLLETKLKQMSLHYENQTMQLKKTNKGLQQKVRVYEDYLQKHQPHLTVEINQKLEDNSDNMSFLSSSSESSSKNDDISIPVLSQIMEVKIQGKKLCDLIKQLNVKNKDLEKLNTVLKDKSKPNLSNSISFNNIDSRFPIPQNLNTGDAFRKGNLQRKYSIPAMYSRHKKQSFQTTIISEKDKTSPSKGNPSSIKICNQCDQCDQLKNYILKFNGKLKKIQGKI